MAENIELQIKFIDALCDRHRLWMNDSEEIQLARLHQEIIETFQDVKQKYAYLLNLYAKPGE